MPATAAKVSPARPSSTVVLVRDADPAPELFMVQRPVSASFGAAHVFPGGVVDATDTEVCTKCDRPDDAEANCTLGVESGGLAYYVAAIRELFEETGVLLACGDVDDAARCEDRERLNEGRLAWTDFVTAHGLELAASELQYFSHWITPDVLPKRYTTRFFMAKMPSGQVADHDPRELIDSCWISAGDALQAAQSGTMAIHYPTQKTLEAIARHGSASALMDWAAACARAGVETIHPTLPPGGR